MKPALVRALAAFALMVIIMLFLMKPSMKPQFETTIYRTGGKTYDLDAMLRRMREPGYDSFKDDEILKMIFHPLSDTTDEAIKLKRWEVEFEYRSVRHETALRDLLLNLTCPLPAKSLVVDSGANVGSTGITLALNLMKHNCPHPAHVLLVEPDEDKVAWMNHKVAESKLDATVVHSGLWSHNTRAELVRELHAGSWRIEADVANGSIQLRSIADIIEEAGLDDLTFQLWHLDVEGAERQALQGLGKHQPAYVLMEVTHDDEGQSASYIVDELGYVDRGPRADNDRQYELPSALAKIEAASRDFSS